MKLVLERLLSTIIKINSRLRVMKWRNTDNWDDDQNYQEFNRPKKNSKVKKMKNGNKDTKRGKSRKFTDFNTSSIEE
jgi:uncharacterized protein YjcR